MSSKSEPLNSASMCRLNVEARWKMLEETLRSPNTADSEFVSVCSSQAIFAAASIPRLKIFPISRNSMYKYADLILSDKLTEGNRSGRFYLDWLRKEVAKLPLDSTSFRSKSKYQERRTSEQDELREKLRLTEATLLIRGSAYLRLVQAFNLISRDPAVEDSTRNRISNILTEQEKLFEQAFRDETFPSDSANIRKLKPK